MSAISKIFLFPAKNIIVEALEALKSTLLSKSAIKWIFCIRFVRASGNFVTCKNVFCVFYADNIAIMIIYSLKDMLSNAVRER